MSKKSSMRLSRSRIILLLAVTLCSGPLLIAQHYGLPLDRYTRLHLLRSDTTHHGSFQGLPVNWVGLDTIKGFEQEKRYSVASNKLYDDHLINIESEDFTAHIDLLLHLEVGTEQGLDNEYQDTTRMSRNMRGFIVRGDIGQKVSFETSFREHQSFLPYYMYLYTQETNVMPGTGRIKPFATTGRDHSIAEGFVAYAPADWVNIQFGSQKNFIGSGYRSLLLSDNSYTYPQVKASFQWFKGKVRYHIIHAWLQTLSRLPQGDTPESLFVKKNGSFKYLEIRPIEKLSIGLFEGVMWNRFEPREGPVALDPLAYSPLIGTAAASIGLDDVRDNVMIGADISARPIPQLLIYGQYVLDKEDRDGFQVGARTVDLGVDGLSLGVEYNSVARFTYANNNIRQNQGHFGQAIAHPMGAGFDELHVDITYFYDRWFLRADYSGADQLIDLPDEVDPCAAGGDIFTTLTCVTDDLDDYKSRLEHLDIRVGKMFNPRSNFNAYIGWMFRERNGAWPEQKQSYFKFGVEMSLFNSYEDF
ncbi:MAG: hypothetical protein HKN79_03845 [Flavobacteriales bacterium]|nr:hypothetical protein [Flavobacteriales bacterium]